VLRIFFREVHAGCGRLGCHVQSVFSLCHPERARFSGRVEGPLPSQNRAPAVCAVPTGLGINFLAYPALKRWANLCRRYAAQARYRSASAGLRPRLTQISPLRGCLNS